MRAIYFRYKDNKENLIKFLYIFLRVFKDIVICVLLILNCLLFVLSETPKQIMLGVNNEKIDLSKDCEYFFIPTNYKHLTININKIKNVDKIIITDQLLDNCMIKECSPLSNICQSIIFDLLGHYVTI